MTEASRQHRRPANLSATQSRGAAPLRGLLPLLMGLIIWQMLASKEVPYFPPPLDWLKSLDTLRVTGRLWPALETTLISFFSALLISIVIGSVLGILLGRSALLDRLLGPTLEFGRTMPAGALVP